jgi:hypothetical protein
MQILSIVQSELEGMVHTQIRKRYSQKMGSFLRMLCLTIYIIFTTKIKNAPRLYDNSTLCSVRLLLYTYLLSG